MPNMPSPKTSYVAFLVYYFPKSSQRTTNRQAPHVRRPAREARRGARGPRADSRGAGGAEPLPNIQE